jgi:hypothetical protein
MARSGVALRWRACGKQSPMTRLVVLTALALAAALAGVACDEKKSSSSVPRAEAGAEKYATADPKLEKALQAVASSAPANDKGPPPNGVFGPGGADQRHARGAPTKVEVLSDGSEPRIVLAPPSAPSPGSAVAGPAALEVVLQLGPRAISAVDYRLALGPAKKDDGGSDWLIGEVRHAEPSKALGQAAPGADKDIASLDGTQIRIQLTADGRESDMQTRSGKASKAELDTLAEAAAEALVLATVPLPGKPVGVGAQWIAETRMPLLGLDAVAYRAYRLKSIEGDRVRLSLDVKGYAATREVQLAGVPKGATLEVFDTQCQGEMELARGETMARKSDFQERVVLAFLPPGAPPPPSQAGQANPQGNLLQAQVQSQATFIRGDDLRAAARQP